MAQTELTGKILRSQLGDVYNRSGHPLDGCPIAALDPISTFSGYQYYANDFIEYTGPTTGVSVSTGGWICNDTNGAVIGGEAAGAGYGILSIATDTAENDCSVLQHVGETWKYVVGKRLWCFARLSISDPADDEAFFGLASVAAEAVDTMAEVLALDDGIYFEKNESNEEWDFHTRKSDVSTESTLCTSTFSAGIMRILGFAVDATGKVTAYEGTTMNDLTEVATVAAGTATIPDDVELCLTFAVEAGAAAANTMKVDWVFVAQER